jgi:acetoin utilization protein AcuB
MLVKYWMRKAVITVNVNDSMQEAISRMREYFVPLLPVIKDGLLVGVVTDRDLKRASASDATTLDIHELVYLMSNIKVGDIMTKNPVTIRADSTLEETAYLLLKHKISGAPVVDEKGRLVGTVGQRDLFRALISLTGFEKRGLQFAFKVEDRPGSIKELTDVIRAYGGRLVSILTSYDRAPAGYRHVYIRAYNVDRSKIQVMLDELRQKTPVLYMVDHRDNKTEEYVEST